MGQIDRLCAGVCVADTQTTGQAGPGPGWPVRLSDMPDRQRQRHWPITLSHCQTTTTVPGRAVPCRAGGLAPVIVCGGPMCHPASSDVIITRDKWPRPSQAESRPLLTVRRGWPPFGRPFQSAGGFFLLSLFCDDTEMGRRVSRDHSKLSSRRPPTWRARLTTDDMDTPRAL